MEYLFNIFQAFQQSLWIQFLDLFIIILQFRKFYFYASNAFSIETFVD